MYVHIDTVYSLMLGYPPHPISSSQLTSKSQSQVSGSGVKSDAPVRYAVPKEKPTG